MCLHNLGVHFIHPSSYFFFFSFSPWQLYLSFFFFWFTPYLLSTTELSLLHIIVLWKGRKNIQCFFFYLWIINNEWRIIKHRTMWIVNSDWNSFFIEAHRFHFIHVLRFFRSKVFFRVSCFLTVNFGTNCSSLWERNNFRSLKVNKILNIDALKRLRRMNVRGVPEPAVAGSGFDGYYPCSVLRA